MLGDIVGGHGGVEGVTTNNLVDVRRGDLAGVDKGVDAVDDELGAAESKHGQTARATELGVGAGLGGRLGQSRKEERRPKHLCFPPWS